jgi:long-chain alkane monooxygenase
MAKEIRLNAFAMNCVAHQSPGLWTHPRDRTAEYNRLPYWIHLAKTLERGRFDGLFLADVLGVYDVYGDSRMQRCAMRRRRPRTSRSCCSRPWPR